jgi:2',3'-cyclic-nucleotide 2'-phosphodiesterase (5'-nucleotidase family)
VFRRLACAAAFAAFLAATPAWATPVDITILHTNDTHDHLEPFNTKDAPDVGGAARRKTLILQVRTSVKNMLLLDAGDVFRRAGLQGHSDDGL